MLFQFFYMHLYTISDQMNISSWSDDSSGFYIHRCARCAVPVVMAAVGSPQQLDSKWHLIPIIKKY